MWFVSYIFAPLFWATLATFGLIAFACSVAIIVLMDVAEFCGEVITAAKYWLFNMRHPNTPKDDEADSTGH